MAPLPATVAALLLPSVVWLNLFGGLLGDKSRPGGDLMVVQHNVGAENADPAGTARDLAASGADVLALVELTEQDRGTYEQGLAAAYPTTRCWARSGCGAGCRCRTAGRSTPGWTSGRSGTPRRPRRNWSTTARYAPRWPPARSPGGVRGPPGVRPGQSRGGFSTGDRDRNAQALAEAVAAERNERVVLLGDLNGTVDDRALAGLTSRLRSAQVTAGDGFGFSWPAAFPVVRIDQILTRGVQPQSSWVLPATGSDHLPVAARLGW
ncbi:endonuclease/exonuclease/phosphatase family protein [Catellatospora coxensis]